MTQHQYTVALPLDFELVSRFADTIRDVVQDAGHGPGRLPNQSVSGLVDYAVGLAFRHQYGEWIAENVSSDEAGSLLHLTKLERQNGFYALVTLDNPNTALLMKLTFGGAV